MASTAQPIALPNSHQQDYNMSVSYNGTNGSFNPASFTRQVLGSPLSWRAGSFGGRFYPGDSSNQMSGPLDPNDFKCERMSSSMESDRGSLLNALGMFERQDELCRDYSCCGQNLTDLHALLEHFERVHVVVVDPFAVPVNSRNPIQPPQLPSQVQAIQLQAQLNQRTPQPQAQPAPSYFPPFDEDNMDLDVESDTPPPPSSAASSNAPSPSSPSPPSTPNSYSYPYASHPSTNMSSIPSSAVTSACSSPYPHAASPTQALEFELDMEQHIGSNHLHKSHQAFEPVSAFDTTTILPLFPHHRPSLPHSTPSHPNAHPRHLAAFPPSSASSRAITPELFSASAFNAYSGYSDYSASMPGTVPSPPASGVEQNDGSGYKDTDCVPPAVLFGGLMGMGGYGGGMATGTTAPNNTPQGSRVPSPSPSLTTHFPRTSVSTTHPSSPLAPRPPTGLSRSNTGSSSTSSTPTTLSRPGTSLLLSKPFRCPEPNCNKSYKQANGLKYHREHGSCSWKVEKEVEEVRSLLASKRSAKAAAASQLSISTTSSPLNSVPTSPTSGPGTPNTDGLSTSPASAYPGISASELLEVEREAERRVRPFACGVGDCQRRYKNMNGLRYHYAHSGEHGRLGMELLARGEHGCLGGGLAGRKGSSGNVGGRRSGTSTPVRQFSGAQQISQAQNQTQNSAQQHTPIQSTYIGANTQMHSSTSSMLAQTQPLPNQTQQPQQQTGFTPTQQIQLSYNQQPFVRQSNYALAGALGDFQMS